MNAHSAPRPNSLLDTPLQLGTSGIGETIASGAPVKVAYFNLNGIGDRRTGRRYLRKGIHLCRRLCKD